MDGLSLLWPQAAGASLSCGRAVPAGDPPRWGSAGQLGDLLAGS
jgi:hypothetical protein